MFWLGADFLNFLFSLLLDPHAKCCSSHHVKGESVLGERAGHVVRASKQPHCSQPFLFLCKFASKFPKQQPIAMAKVQGEKKSGAVGKKQHAWPGSEFHFSSTATNFSIPSLVIKIAASCDFKTVLNEIKILGHKRDVEKTGSSAWKLRNFLF